MRNLRKYILPSLLILALAGSFAVAQTFVRAIQLSQDTTGAFAIDSNNGVYFPGHILSTGTGRPAPTVSSGATTPTIAGTDFASHHHDERCRHHRNRYLRPSLHYRPNLPLLSMNGTVTTTVSYVPATTSVAITASGAVGVNNKATLLCTGPS